MLCQKNTIWDKISSLLKKEFDSEPVYNDKYFMYKIKLYSYNANVYGNNVPKIMNAILAFLFCY